MPQKSQQVQYSVIDAFTDSPFKGNPAAVCLLEEERDDEWMQGVAAEFNVSDTAFLTRLGSQSTPTFKIRWFTPVAEVELCGHATIAAAHFLFSNGLVTTGIIKFLSKSGPLTAKRVANGKQMDASETTDMFRGEQFSIELDFPTISMLDCDPTEVPVIPATLNGASMVNVKKTTTGDLIVELSSGEAVVGLQPQFDELKKCFGRGVIITAPAPHGSGFDIFSRFFAPKLGINEDPVCGSAHCALVPYWSEKLGKLDLIAYMASPRGGRLDLYLQQDAQRVLIRGEAVPIMTGIILV